MSSYSVFRSKIPVRPDDIDMNRHVHSSRYADYVHAARFDQMERCYGMSMEAFAELGLGWVVRTSHVEHRDALRMGDVAEVETHIAEIRKYGVKVEFTIFRESDGKTAARGWFDYILVNALSGKPLTIPYEIIAKYSI